MGTISFTKRVTGIWVCPFVYTASRIKSSLGYNRLSGADRKTRGKDKAKYCNRCGVDMEPRCG